MIVYVYVIGAGSGTNDTYGLYLNNIRWASSAATDTTWKTGFTDQRLISDIKSVCNITQGGQLGGFDGDVTVIARSSDIVDAVIDKTLNFVGKEIHISIGLTDNPADAVRRYTGIISAWTILDEVDIEFTCVNALSYNTNERAGITVSKEMALNVANSPAIGKTIGQVYGNICDYPLINIPTDSDYYSILIKSSTTLVDCVAPSRAGYSDLLTKSGTFKGKTLLMVHGVYQLAKENIFVALSYNGDKLFTASAESSITTIKNALQGACLRVVRGSGSGTNLKILDVVWDTHTVEGKSLETVWLQLDSKDASLLRDSATYDSTFEDDDREVHKMLFDSNQSIRSDVRTYGISSSDLKTPYNDGSVVNDVSYVELSAFRNLFIVSSDCNIQDSTLIGVSQSGEASFVTIPSASISEVYSTDEWKMISVDVSKLISSDESSFSYTRYDEIETRYVDDSVTTGGITEHSNGVGYSTGSPEVVATSTDSASDGSLCLSGGAETTLTHSYAVATGSTTVYMFQSSLLMVPIEDLVNGSEIVSGGILSAIPKAKYNFNVGYTNEGAPQAFMKLIMSVSAVGEGNVVLGEAKYNDTIRYNNITAAHNTYLEIDPVNGRIKFDSLVEGGVTNDYAMFDRMKSALDISSFTNAPYSRQIRGIYVRVICNLVYYVYEAPTFSFTLTKTVYPVYLGYSQSVSKDKLYLRSNNVSASSISSPAMLAKAVAVDSGLTVDAYSFNVASGVQRGMFAAASSSFDGQYLRTNETTGDILSDIAKGSLMAIYQKPDGVTYAKDIISEIESEAIIGTYDGSKIKKGSFSLSRPLNGYRYNSFDFSLRKNLYGSHESVFINTSVASAFPLQDVYESTGDPVSGAYGWDIDNIEYSRTQKYITASARRVSDSINPMVAFVLGSRFKLTSVTSDEVYGTLTSMAPDLECPVGYKGVLLGFTIDSSTVMPSSFALYSIQAVIPVDSWRKCVSGSFVSDYETSRIIWEFAKAVKDETILDCRMPSDSTSLDSPIWSSDEQAIQQWILKTTQWATSEKTVIRLRTAMTAGTMIPCIMDRVAVSFGPYQTNTKYGWIVESTDIVDAGEIDLTILVVENIANALVLDESENDETLTLDESSNTVTETYTEAI